MRLLAIGLISFVLFFPTYWGWHLIFGEDVGAILSLLSCILLYPYLIGKVWKDYPPIEVVPIERDDEFNLKCIERARSELHRLDEGLKDGKKQAFVKYEIRANEESADHVWGIAHRITDKYVVVSLINEPVYHSDDRDSDPRDKVPMDEIQDWMLVDKHGVCEGGYTHLAMVHAYSKLHGKVPKKYLRDLKQFVDISDSEYAEQAFEKIP